MHTLHSALLIAEVSLPEIVAKLYLTVFWLRLIVCLDGGAMHANESHRDVALQAGREKLRYLKKFLGF